MSDNATDLLRRIKEAELECRRRKSEVDAKKEELKDAKDVWEASVEFLMKLIREEEDKRPLLDGEDADGQ